MTRYISQPAILFPILLVLLAVQPAGAELIGYWSFDETTGATASDMSGSAVTYDGALTGFATPNAQWAAGKFGNGLKFDDADDRVLVNAPVIPLGAAWTVSAWFSTPLPATGTWHTLFRGSAAGNNHPVLGRNTDNVLGTFDNSGSGFHATVPAYDLDTLSLPGWAHIAAVGSGGTTKFYIDGSYVGTAAFQSTSDIELIGNVGSGQRFANMLDDVAVWDEALAPATIANLVNGPVKQEKPILRLAGGTGARNNHTGTVGIQFTVGATDRRVTALGFEDSGGDGLTTAHDVGLWDNSGTLLDSVNVPAGTVAPLIDAWRYVDLASPITLTAGETYRIGGRVVSGDGDGWSDMGGAAGFTLDADFSSSGFGDVFSSGDFSDPTQNGTLNDLRWGPGNALFAPVPEPASAMLLIAGLLFASPGLLRRRRRRRR